MVGGVRGLVNGSRGVVGIFKKELLRVTEGNRTFTHERGRECCPLNVPHPADHRAESIPHRSLQQSKTDTDPPFALP